MVLGQGNPFTRLANPLSTIAPTIAPVRLALADAAFAGSAVASASRAIVLDPQLLAESLKSARAGALEATPQPRSQSCKKVKRTITFTGCGGLWNYLFGVACYMQQNFEIDPSTTAFASASAGAYPAFLLAAGIDVEEFHHSANRQFIESVQEDLKDSRSAALGVWNDAIKEHFTPAVTSRLTPSELADVLHRRHYISLTRLPSLENELIGEFDSVDDLVEGFIASGFLPIYDRSGHLGATWRGQRFFDGGLSDNEPLPFDDVPSLVLSPSKWREHEDVGSVVPVPFVRANWEWCNAKFELGFQDAKARHDELAEFFED